MPTQKKVINLRNISKQYQIDTRKFSALQNVSFEIRSGEFVAIMGPSGAGKTTLLNILGLLDVPSSGSYKFIHKETMDKPEKELAKMRHDSIGFVFQSSNLLADYTLVQNVQMPLIYRNYGYKASRREALLVLQQLGLFDKQNNKPSQLSTGQLQKGAIACALVQKPKVLCADEPTGNLDSVSTKEIVKLLQKLNKDGITIVLVTHNKDVAKHADRIVHMQDGAIVKGAK